MKLVMLKSSLNINLCVAVKLALIPPGGFAFAITAACWSGRGSDCAHEVSTFYDSKANSDPLFFIFCYFSWGKSYFSNTSSTSGGVSIECMLILLAAFQTRWKNVWFPQDKWMRLWKKQSLLFSFYVSFCLLYILWLLTFNKFCITAACRWMKCLDA